MFYAVVIAIAAGGTLICCHEKSSVSLDWGGLDVPAQMQLYTGIYQIDNI